MRDFWHQRYSEPGLAYGLEPNNFLSDQVEKLKPGARLLVVGDGEGRNGVWLAARGFQVTSVDYAEPGVAKARALADKTGVELDAQCADLDEWAWPEAEYDAVISIFVHFPSNKRAIMHRRMLAALKAGGLLIMEAFNKAQLAYPSGGPPLEDMLFSAELLAQDFAAARIEMLEESVVELNEGKYHVGPGAVVRMLTWRE